MVFQKAFVALVVWVDGWIKRITFQKSRPPLDFLTIHYLYIIGMTLLSSLLIFAGGGIRYIDALFLGSSSCTQAGLATLNINDLNTWQQVCFFLFASLTNPIVIHSATAFVRLYWFQKRFAHIVEETNRKMLLRKTKSRAQSMEQEERGVGGREIRVLFDSGRNQQMPVSRRDTETDRSADGRKPRRKASGTSIGERLSGSSFFPRRRSTSVVDDVQNPLIDAEKHTTEVGGGDKSQSSESASSDLVEKSDTRDTELVRPPSNVSQAISDGEDEAPVNTVDSKAEEEEPELSPTTDVQRNTADIRFAELPVPRKHNAEEGGHSGRHASMSVSRMNTNDEYDQNTGEKITQRTSTNDRASRGYKVHRRRSSVSRYAGRTTTLERTITAALRRPRRDSTPNSRSTSRAKVMELPYISFQPTIGRNSAFTSLTSEQRAELGGIEYRATKTLCGVLVGYFFGFHLFGFVCFIAFIYSAQQYVPVVANAGVSRGWWSVFSSASAFNDLGLALTPDSFISFQNAAFLLIIASFLIVIGNTGFPCMLRFVIWVLYKIWPGSSPVKEEFLFLLDHPRRCFTLLFPGSATWWLFAILVGLNGLDLVLFIVLDLGNPAVTDIPVGYRIVTGLFQAFCTRTAGFTAVNIGLLHSAILVSYMIMMYISVFPVAISIRRTNVYEERSLGIYSAEDEEEGNNQQSFVGTHVRRQLGHDLWYIFLALFIICKVIFWHYLLLYANFASIVENPEIQNASLQSFNIFNVMFEIISAYGTVGLSIGFPGVDYSLSGQFHTLSKLVIIALQIRGRHRGLPLKLDRAVLLPSEKLIEKEEEDGALRLNHSRSFARTMSRQPTMPVTRERQD